MTRERLLTLVVLALLLLNLTTLGYVLWQTNRSGAVQERGPHPRTRPEDIIIGKLQLDEGQQERLWQSIERHREASHRLNDELTDLRRAYFALLSDDAASTAMKIGLEQAISANRQAYYAATYAHFDEIRALCRPDQLTRFDELMEALLPFFGGRGPGGPPPPDGPPPF